MPDLSRHVRQPRELADALDAQSDLTDLAIALDSFPRTKGYPPDLAPSKAAERCSLG
ncbi:hypothetical protein [Streptomyces coerulescens]|uniref:Uncharacterized protein n=1 Tax=Streptomyces coerulescens TaxID=29304 RepID=A0ABW0CCF1_STRCD